MQKARFRAQVSRALDAPSEAVSKSTTKALIETEPKPNIDESELTKMKEMIRRGRESDRETVEQYIKLLNCRCGHGETFLMLECSLYFDSLGDARRALEVAKLGVDKATRSTDLGLQRKGHNIISVAYTRVCDFEKSCFHLDRALQLARDLKDSVAEFATLSNAVSTLACMGLAKEAFNLSKHLMTYAGGTNQLDYFHLQNAINGLKLARHFDDISLAEEFNGVAQAKLLRLGHVEEYWIAYVESQHALCLLTQGNIAEAHEVILKALEKNAEVKNLRVESILSCAYAKCVLQMKDADEILKSKTVLDNLLKKTKSFAVHQEDILRALIELYSYDKTAKEREIGLKFVRRLSEHLVNVKHRQFFVQLGSQSGRFAFNSDMDVHYDLPHAFTEDLVGARVNRSEFYRRDVDRREKASKVALSFMTSMRRKTEMQLRTKEFEIAEDWAVAADFCVDHTESHCFEVGRLCGLIAMQLGFSVERSVIVEMACRLHDIGKIAISEITFRGARDGIVDEYLIISEHTFAGERILGVVDDVVFRAASLVAGCHHEWWNGCGVPRSCLGEDIPLEARICFVANSYLHWTRLENGRNRWSSLAAVRQIVTMSGVQLDPEIVQALVALHDSGKLLECSAEAGNNSKSRNNRLIASKVKLLNIIETVVQ